MSILITGMGRPKDGCKSCAFDILGICLIKANMDKPYEVTHSCPLIELPEHGRLIDADALMLRVDCHGTNKFGMLDEDIREFINAAPTIIPADGGADIDRIEKP